MREEYYERCTIGLEMNRIKEEEDQGGTGQGGIGSRTIFTRVNHYFKLNIAKRQQKKY